MAGRHRTRRTPRRTLAVSTWLGAGAATVGMGAVLLGGAAVANAKPSSDSGSTASAPSAPSAAATPAAPTHPSDKHLTRKAAASTPSASDAQPDSAQPHSTHAKNPAPEHPAFEALAKVFNVQPHSARVDPPTATPPVPNPSPAPQPAASIPAAPATASPASGSAIRSAAAVSPTSAAAHAAAPTAAATAPSTGVSGLLSVLTAVGQALNTAVRDTEQTLAAAAQSVSETLSRMLGSASSTPAASTTTYSAPPWQPGQTMTTSQYVQTALQEISSAQATLTTATQGNLFASFAAFLPQWYLSTAANDLKSWQSGNASALQFYQQNYNNFFLGGWAAAMLNYNESLPGMAVSALNVAKSLTSGIGNPTATSAANALIAQAATNGRVYASVPLYMYAGTEPIVYISVNGGPSVAVLVDTGSSGLVIDGAKVGSGLGSAVGSGTGAYADGLTYNYNEYDTTVNFGSSVQTGSTAVDVITDPTQQAAFDSYLSGDGVVGVLGIGSNAVGPGPSLVTSALPGPLSEGVLINEAAGKLEFGANPLPVRASVSGSPNAAGTVTVNGNSTPLNLLIDSGGVTGTIPSTVISSVPNGTKISVYASDGTLLYSYTTSSSNSPSVTTDDYDAGQLNTGATPFQQGPVYVGYDTADGTTAFDY